MRLLALLMIGAPWLASAGFGDFLNKDKLKDLGDNIKNKGNDIVFDALNDRTERITDVCRNVDKDLPGDFWGQSNWMKDLRDDRRITSLYLPGTHDSGAVQGGFFSQTQALSIYQQLRSGIRFLDVRVALSARQLHVYHGITYQGKSFVDVLNDIRRFLNENNRDFVIMRLRRENDKDDSNEIKNTFLRDYDQFKNMFYFGKSIGDTEVRDVRGKIIVLEDRFDSGIQNRKDYFGNIDQQDKWDAADVNDKKNHINNFKNSNRNSNKLSLNYFSFAANMKSLNPSVSACQINSLAREGNATPQVMIFDMPSLQIVREVYKRNF
jgi:1-phosphatidylinositol phosphodiesterase